ncbi:hypothetical protein BsWGS_28244 [Bradybaena similaris]
MAAPCSLDSSVGDGDFSTVKLLLESGVDANTRTRDGMTPLAVSAFWGYDTIVQLLLQYGADINAANCGTLWTPLHCAAFQGHGKVIMILMEHGPELSKKEIQGRTAADFASAHDSIWPFFAAEGCKRTPRSELIKMNIVQQGSWQDSKPQKLDLLDFSRPDSGYSLGCGTENGNQHALLISSTGDVLAADDDGREHANCDRRMSSPSLVAWRN